MELDEFNVYRQAMDWAEQVYDQVKGWDDFSKETIGKPFIEAADWIAANLSRGFGRHLQADQLSFTYHSRGVLYECFTWLKKANNRGLIGPFEYEEMSRALSQLLRMLNMYADHLASPAQAPRRLH